MRWLLPAGALVLLAGCAPLISLDRTQLSGKTASVAIQDVPTHGFRVELVTPARVVEGELLAVDADHFWIQPADAKDWVYVHRQDAREVYLQLYEAQTTLVGMVAVFNTLLSISNGYYGVLTAPLNIIAGTIAAVTAYHAEHFAVEARNWNLLVQFARFPQGLPGSRVHCPQHPDLTPVLAAPGQRVTSLAEPRSP